MVRIKAKAFGLFVPAVGDVFIGGEPFQHLEALGKVLGHQEGMEVSLSVLVGWL
jgi:hypothetical protein